MKNWIGSSIGEEFHPLDGQQGMNVDGVRKVRNDVLLKVLVSKCRHTRLRNGDVGERIHANRFRAGCFGILGSGYHRSSGL